MTWSSTQPGVGGPLGLGLGSGDRGPQHPGFTAWLIGSWESRGPQGSGGCGSGAQTPQTSAPASCQSQKTPPTKSPPSGWKPGRPRVTPTPPGASEAARSRAVGTGLAFPLQPWGASRRSALPRSALGPAEGPAGGRRRAVRSGDEQGPPPDSGQSAPHARSRTPTTPALTRAPHAPLADTLTRGHKETRGARTWGAAEPHRGPFIRFRRRKTFSARPPRAPAPRRWPAGRR